MRFLFKNSLLVQEAWKMLNHEARKQKLKRKLFCNFSYTSHNHPVLIEDILFTKNKPFLVYTMVPEKHIFCQNNLYFLDVMQIVLH